MSCFLLTMLRIFRKILFRFPISLNFIGWECSQLESPVIMWLKLQKVKRFLGKIFHFFRFPSKTPRNPPKIIFHFFLNISIPASVYTITIRIFSLFTIRLHKKIRASSPDSFFYLLKSIHKPHFYNRKIQTLVQIMPNI